MSLAPGDKAPDFTLPASGGRTVRLKDHKGRLLILYFYPKANTSGCTREACDFQEALPQLGKLGVDVIGVSPDAMKPIESFAQKYSLTFPLASDTEKTVAQAYGVWGEKMLYGRKYMGITRSTFLIGGDGRILAAWRNVKVPGHAAAVAQAVRSATSPAG